MRSKHGFNRNIMRHHFALCICVTSRLWIFMRLRVTKTGKTCYTLTCHTLRTLRNKLPSCYVPAPIGWGGNNALTAVVCLSVCLSVCAVPDPKSKTEGRSKLENGRKETHDTGDPWPHLEFEMSNTCREGNVNVQWAINCIMISKLKAVGGCLSHQLQGAGACCGGPTTGCTACFLYLSLARRRPHVQRQPIRRSTCFLSRVSSWSARASTLSDWAVTLPPSTASTAATGRQVLRQSEIPGVWPASRQSPAKRDAARAGSVRDVLSVTRQDERKNETTSLRSVHPRRWTSNH